jgi:hypothetical protein
MRLFLAALAICFLSHHAVAQDTLSLTGKKCLFLTLQDYQFHNFGFRYWLSNRIGLNTAISFMNDTRTLDNSDWGFLSPSHNTSFAFGLSAQVNIYSYEGATLYTSLGGEYGSNRNVSTHRTGSDPYDYVTTNEWLDFLAGIGVEYFILNSLSISGQEFFIVSSNKETASDPFSNPDIARDHDYYLGNLSIVVAFYF